MGALRVPVRWTNWRRAQQGDWGSRAGEATCRISPLHTSTVVTDRNLPFLLDIYRFLRGHGVDQVVFNVMQANGRADQWSRYSRVR